MLLVGVKILINFIAAIPKKICWHHIWN